MRFCLALLVLVVGLVSFCALLQCSGPTFTYRDSYAVDGAGLKFTFTEVHNYDEHSWTELEIEGTKSGTFYIENWTAPYRGHSQFVDSWTCKIDEVPYKHPERLFVSYPQGRIDIRSVSADGAKLERTSFTYRQILNPDDQARMKRCSTPRENVNPLPKREPEKT